MRRVLKEVKKILLHTNYFPSGSREKLKATLLSLMLLLAIVIMILDVRESMLLHHHAMSVVEGTTVGIFFVTYLLFPRYLSLETVVNLTVAVIGLLFVLSLTLNGANPQYSLFWLATLPVYIFFFLGAERGVKWSMAFVLLLVLTIVNSILKWYPPLYDTDFLIQLTLGYMAISYLLYSMEKERQEYEHSLEKALQEKEILLKEVHHRTKNNMQIMIGLLETQSFKIDDPKYKRMFQAHVERLKAMSIVHEHLYRSGNYERVRMDYYLGDLISSLQYLTAHKIVTQIDPLEMDMKHAMNLGLVLNEALSNAIEHAYSENERGVIYISLKQKEGSRCLLSVKDEGRGFDASYSYQTMGMTLMRDISSMLDDECMEIDTKEGTEVKMYCQVDNVKEGKHGTA